MQLRTTTKSRFVSVLQSLLLSAGWGGADREENVVEFFSFSLLSFLRSLS